MINQTVNVSAEDISHWYDYASSIPKYLTNKIIEVLNSQNIHVSERWTSTIMFGVVLILIFLIIKIGEKLKPLIKAIIIMILVVLIIGLILPIW